MADHNPPKPLGSGSEPQLKRRRNCDAMRVRRAEHDLLLSLRDEWGVKDEADTISLDVEDVEAVPQDANELAAPVAPCSQAEHCCPMETPSNLEALHPYFADLSDPIVETPCPSTAFDALEMCGIFSSIVFDCDICVSCKCYNCEECVHLEGNLCQHCDRCVECIDSDVEETRDSCEETHDSRQETQDDRQPINLNFSSSELLSEKEKKNLDIRNDFISIVTEHGITHEAIGSLLKYFRKHEFGDFPKDPTTLLKTPSVVVTRNVAPGIYWHRGITCDLIKFVKKHKCSVVKVTVSSDGLPIAKSSGGHFYPICCSFNNFKEVYLAGLWYGHMKPDDCDLFLEDFVSEMNSLVETGIDVDGHHASIEMHLGIFDTVAKAMVLNVKGHSGYFSCSKCTEEGVKIGGRMTFPDCNAPLRTDDSFNQLSQEDHHHGSTILSKLKSFKPVTNVVLDYMHLVLLGVLRTLMFMWIAGPKKVRQGGQVLAQISQHMESLSEWVPCEFVRKPRSLTFVKRFKATEWRMLLFYVGVIVLSHLPQHLYQHFLVLHVAMTIYARPDLCYEYMDYAKEIVMFFLQTFKRLYGKEFIVHNFHNLCHLWLDVLNHGPLDSFSAFKFENFLQKLKRMIRKGDKPIQQVAKRYEELKQSQSQEQSPQTWRDYLSGLHCSGPLPAGCFNPQYSSFFDPIRSIKINLSNANCCCKLNDDSIIQVENIAHSAEKKLVFVGRKFLDVKDLYSIPCPSSLLGIHHVSNLSPNLSFWPCSELTFKCFRMPVKGGFAVIPLIHCDDSRYRYLLNCV